MITLMSRITLVGLLLLLGVIVGCGDSTVSLPSPDISPAARVVLNKLESAEYITVQSDIVYKSTSLMLGEREIRTGRMAFQKELLDNDKVVTPTRARMTFVTVQHGRGRETTDRVDYVIDDKRLKLGKGTFSIPFGQKTKYLMDLFEVTILEKTRRDPADTYCIQLVPRSSRRADVNFIWLKMWIDDNSDLPVRVISKDSNKTITEMIFRETKTLNSVVPGLFGDN